MKTFQGGSKKIQKIADHILQTTMKFGFPNPEKNKQKNNLKFTG